MHTRGPARSYHQLHKYKNWKLEVEYVAITFLGWKSWASAQGVIKEKNLYDEY